MLRFPKTAAHLAVAGLVSLGATATAAERPSLEIYGRLPALEDVQISPDGTLIAVAATNGEQRLLILRKTADNSPVAGIRVGTAKLRRVQWAGSGRIVSTVSTTAAVFSLSGPRREYAMATVYDLTTQKQTLLLAHEEDAMNVVVGTVEPRTLDGDPVLFVPGVHFINHRGQTALYAANLRTGRSRRIDPVSEDANDWLVDAHGAPLAQSDYNQTSGVWTLRMKVETGWKVVERLVMPTGGADLAGLGRDGRSALVRLTSPDGLPQLREYAVDGTKTLLPAEQSVNDLLYDPVSHALIGGSSLIGDDRRYRFYDAAFDKTWAAVLRAFPGDRVTLVSWSDNRRKVVVKVDSPSLGPAYALVDLDAGKASWLGDVYRDMPAEAVSEVRLVTYKAADGLTIQGYLTLPRGRAAKNLPLVVLPHGGPAVRDEPGFDWWAQALASRGYAVLQPNFRGSDGFGWRFLSAGFGEWGRKMQTDLSDGVRDLAAQGVIDPKRVCIVGASYGGYAALAGATLDPGVYRCAASVAGPADLRRFLQSGQSNYATRDNSRLRYWSRFMGVDGLRDPDLAVISPARLADKVEIPVLLIHGKDDTVVPYEQSQIMASALKKAGKPVEFVTLPGEDHWLSSGATRLQMLTAMTAFLEKNNPVE